MAESKSLLNAEEVSSDVLVARVRSKLGRYVSHPHAIEVFADNGRVTLKGLILDYEVPKLIRALRKVKGVDDVINELEVHQRYENLPSLQGGIPRSGERIDLFQRNRAPATNFLISVVGIGTLAYSVSKRKAA